MKPADNINNLFENSKITVGSDVDKKILKQATSALPHPAAQPDRPIWSMIMHSKITKLSGIAAVILLVAIITIINKITPKAWAIEQTIEAFKDIHTVKLECYTAGLVVIMVISEGPEMTGLHFNALEKKLTASFSGYTRVIHTIGMKPEVVMSINTIYLKKI